MNINIEVIVSIQGGRSLHYGRYDVLNSDFRKYPDWTAAVAAYQFIQKINFTTGYHDDTKVLKVTYDGDNDITDLVKKVRPVIKDYLMF